VTDRPGNLALVVRVARAPELRRVQFAFAGFSIGEHATWLAVLVYALERGGVREVGLVAFVQLLPGVLLVPFAAYAGDRYRPQRALAVGYATQCVAMTVTAIAMWADGWLVAYVAATVAATAISFTRPVMGSLLPTVTHVPRDLVAANVVAGLIEQIGLFVGPLAAALLLAIGSPEVVFGVCASLTGAGFLALARTRPDDDLPDDLAGERPDAGDLAHELVAGFRALRVAPRARVLVSFFAVAGFVKGVGDVVFVTFTDERLGGGGGIAGVVAAAYGLGGMAGAFAVTRLVRGAKVTGQFLGGAGLVAAGFAALAVVGDLAPALALFAAAGAGETLLQLTAVVTLQRSAPTEVLARVFGIVEAAQMAALALGSLAIGAVSGWWTLGESFVAAGLVTLAGVAVLVVVLGRHPDDLAPVDDSIVDRLVVDPVFASLPAPKIERLARSVGHGTFAAGDVVFEEGRSGNDYHLICDGRVRVTVAGAWMRDLGPGDSYGEIALLRGTPRTATVVALEPLSVLIVERDDFLETVTGHPRSLATANRVADRFLGS
jgi:predicted MFS family arabinose efflux permease